MPRVSRRIALAITVLCVLLCYISLPVVLAAIELIEPPINPVLYSIGDVEPLTTLRLTRHADGSSTGVYYQPELKLLIRRRGNALTDVDTTIDPVVYLPFLVVPPVLWFFTHRPSRARSAASRRFACACAFCPLVVNCAVLALRHRDRAPVFFNLWLMVGALIYALTRFARLPSRTARRIRQGRCPRCAYDLRATPTRCPECGYRI